LGNMVSGGQS